MKATKTMSYTKFMELSPEQRKMQSEYFLKNHPNTIPAILKSQSPQLPQLRNCKYLIPADQQMFSQLALMRAFILKNTKLSKQEQLFFYSKSKIINAGTKGKLLYQSAKNTLLDGWLVISYAKQATF